MGRRVYAEGVFCVVCKFQGIQYPSPESERPTCSACGRRNSVVRLPALNKLARSFRETMPGPGPKPAPRPAPAARERPPIQCRACGKERQPLYTVCVICKHPLEHKGRGRPVLSCPGPCRAAYYRRKHFVYRQHLGIVEA